MNGLNSCEEEEASLILMKRNDNIFTIISLIISPFLCEREYIERMEAELMPFLSIVILINYESDSEMKMR